jgi:hypothetical protein
MTEREQFDVWAKEHYLSLVIRSGDGEYLARNTQSAWEGWQARAAQPDRNALLMKAMADELLELRGSFPAKEHEHLYADHDGIAK